MLIFKLLLIFFERIFFFFFSQLVFFWSDTPYVKWALSDYDITLLSPTPTEEHVNNSTQAEQLHTA